MNMLATQIPTAAAGAYALRAVQKWNKLPWITQHTKHMTIAFRAGISFASTLGIHFVWNGADRSLLITLPTLMVLLFGLWHWFSLYAMQHAWGNVFNIGTLQTIETPVQVEKVKGDEK